MLGINVRREVIKGKFAREIRESVWRAVTGNFNAKEKEQQQRSEKIKSLGNVIWK